MTGIWALAALWVGLALIATLLSIWLRISSALSEIVVGTIAQLKANSIACRDSQAMSSCALSTARSPVRT